MSQIVKKFISNNAVDETKIRLNNNAALKARNAANSADVDIIKVNASDKAEMTATLTMGAFKLEDALVTFKSSSTDPGSPVAGDVYYNDVSNVLRFYNGTAWSDVSSASGANTALSNLASVAINESLISDTDVTDDLGSPSLRWNNIFAALLQDSSNVTVFDIEARELKASDGSASFNFSSTTELVSKKGIVSVRQGGVNAKVALYETTDTYAVGLQANPAMTASFGLVLPEEDGTNGQVLTTNGAGQLSFETPASSVTNDKALITLSGTDITNQYVDLTEVALTDSIIFSVKGQGTQLEGAAQDYSVSYTGGAGGKTRITFLNDLATGGVNALVASDVIEIKYQF